MSTPVLGPAVVVGQSMTTVMVVWIMMMVAQALQACSDSCCVVGWFSLTGW